MKKRLTIENRMLIEQLLRVNYKLKDIAYAVDSNPSTVSREIIKRRITGKGVFKECEKTKRFPFVCNGCPNKAYCRKKKYYYNYIKAQNNYEYLLKNSRIGIDMTIDEVDYWNELCEIMRWTRRHVYSTLYICWAAMAGLYFHYNIPKYPLEKKLFGVFPHKAEIETPLLRGFDDIFPVPHSRHSEVHRSDIEQCESLQVLSYSPLAGVYMVASRNGREYFITGHAEYERDTLKQEYFRDLERGLPIEVPFNYFPGDNPNCEPKFSWRCHANLMYSNWLNYCVYQMTPFDITELRNMEGKA